MIGQSSLASLPVLRDYVSKRASSFDTQGNNDDFLQIAPTSAVTILHSSIPGCVKHIWMTVGGDEMHGRNIVLRAWWDGEANPSIETPLGDFFGIGHGLRRNFVSLPLQMSPEDGRGMNCWFPMPFDTAIIEVANDGPELVNLYFYIDYEEYRQPTAGMLARFHAQWSRESKTEGWLTERLASTNIKEVWSREPNIVGRGNYVILEAQGEGAYVGCNLNIDVFERQGNDWYGEGDDMIFVDGETWPPKLHGTGTEDYFNMAFCPKTEYCAPCHGLTVYSGTDEWPWKGKNSMYRFHIEDPIRFRENIRVTIEHGHANKLSNDYSSTAYWYQHEPHANFPELLPVGARLPRA